MGDFNAQIVKITNFMQATTGKFGLCLRKERGDTLVEWATSRKYKLINTMFQKKAGVTKIEIDYIITNRPTMVTDVTFINQANLGSDHRLVMSTIKLDIKVEMSRSHTNRVKDDRIII